MEQGKSSAPALERGIKLLELLKNGQSMSLEELARRLDAPKSSVLRLAETLESLGIIERREGDKTYFARYVLTPLQEKGGITDIIREEIGPLSEASGCTVEWYVFDRRNKVFQITERAEPREAAVFVRAKLGFQRALDIELEAVTTLGLALGYGELNRDRPLWVRRDDAPGNIPLAFEDAKTHVEQAGRELFAEDFGYNIQGVRRMAAAVTGADGRPAGILALAQSYTPGAAETAEKNAVLLKETAQRIHHKLEA